jgi:hypothetical protein
MCSGGGDHECVEDLVEAEGARPRVWPMPRVDDRARGVEDPAGCEQREWGGVEDAQELGQGNHGEPSEGEVAARNGGARHVDPAERKRHSDRSPCPGANQHEPSDRAMHED